METSDNNKRLHMLVQVASHEVQSFDTVYFNDEALTLSSSIVGNDENGIPRLYPTSPSKYSKDSEYARLPSLFGSGLSLRKAVEIQTFSGTDTQLAPSDLVGQVSNWTTDHRLRGIAYVYVQLDYDPDMFPNGIPNISAEIKGKKLFDFRDNSTEFSSNPALCIYDYLTDTN